MDDLLQWTNTPAANLKYERRIDEWATLMTPDAALDFAKWRTWGKTQTLAQAVAILTNQYFHPGGTTFSGGRRFLNRNRPTRRWHSARSTSIRLPQSGGGFLQLTNVELLAVDLSGWKISGGVTHTFASGTVAGGEVRSTFRRMSWLSRPQDGANGRPGPVCRGQLPRPASRREAKRCACSMQRGARQALSPTRQPQPRATVFRIRNHVSPARPRPREFSWTRISNLSG